MRPECGCLYEERWPPRHFTVTFETSRVAFAWLSLGKGDWFNKGPVWPRCCKNEGQAPSPCTSTLLCFGSHVPKLFALFLISPEMLWSDDQKTFKVWVVIILEIVTAQQQTKHSERPTRLALRNQCRERGVFPVGLVLFNYRKRSGRLSAWKQGEHIFWHVAWEYYKCNSYIQIPYLPGF